MSNNKNLVSVDIEDYLTEDPLIHNQQYFILSYILPDASKNELKTPLFKMRGAYKTIEECEKRIKRLELTDKYFTMFICEVGKFGGLFTQEEIVKNELTDIKYRESTLNTMVKEYKDNKDKADLEFENRKEFMKKRADFLNSKKGQEMLAAKKENPISINERITSFEKQKEDLIKRIEEMDIVINKDKEVYSSFTEEELEKSKKEFEEYQKNIAEGKDIGVTPSDKYLFDTYFENNTNIGGLDDIDPWLKNKLNKD